ncbi:MAG: glutamine amidotransferase [Proteobacteria bacterium]|nr:glutamine amidotransferase [Cystobacterineae bacterium]MCL2258710.1 glutamine amidotransferase [Cystobacterineae bacterium]MCL2315000.1 glutamine amidotransferase [Pseudomonadota bacterium]
MEFPALHTSEWVSFSPLPAWLWWGAVFFCMLSLGAGYWGLRRERSALMRRLLLGLRWLAAAMLLLFLLEPGQRSRTLAHLPGRIALLVDQTASMQLPSRPGGETRMAEALKVVQALLEQRSERPEGVELFGFGESLMPATLAWMGEEVPKAEHTDLLAGLRALSQATQGSKPLVGVVLVSDGADNTRLRHGISAQAAEFLKGLGIPVSTVLVGEENLKDVAIERIQPDGFAFVRSKLQVDASIRIRGFKGKKLSVSLKSEGQLMASKEIQAELEDEVQTVAFEVTPDRTGRFVYTVGVEVSPEEVLVDNNERSFSLKVIRDRIRVLLVSGRPSWEERFLRGLLKEDSNIELISFYILRNHDDPTEVSNEGEEMSLIPFPMREIFDEQLASFDVVIFQNFGYSEPQLMISLYEGNLERYLFRGGAFLLMGGDRSLGESKQGFQELARALPVEAAGRAEVQLFSPHPTPEGLRHPITAFGKDSEETKRLWAQLPLLQGLNRTRAKKAATVLLEHPTLSAGAQRLPVFALWEYGRGRVAALMVDSTWHWAFLAHSTGAPSHSYERFFKNTLRWLTRDPELTPLLIAADAPRFSTGKVVGASLKTRTVDYAAAPHTRISLELVSLEKQQRLQVLELETDEEGHAHVEFNGLERGAYKLLARGIVAAEQESQDAFVIEPLGEERSTARVSSQLLKSISESTQGRFFKSNAVSLKEVPLKQPAPIEIDRSKDEPKWDRWYFFVLFVVCCMLEWALRRRLGYV